METFGAGMPSCHPMRARHITIFCTNKLRDMSVDFAEAASGHKVTPTHELFASQATLQLRHGPALNK